jgi:hypothetical protein
MSETIHDDKKNNERNSDVDESGGSCSDMQDVEPGPAAKCERPSCQVHKVPTSPKSPLSRWSKYSRRTNAMRIKDDDTIHQRNTIGIQGRGTANSPMEVMNNTEETGNIHNLSRPSVSKLNIEERGPLSASSNPRYGVKFHEKFRDIKPGVDFPETKPLSIIDTIEPSKVTKLSASSRYTLDSLDSKECLPKPSRKKIDTLNSGADERMSGWWEIHKIAAALLIVCGMLLLLALRDSMWDVLSLFRYQD